MARRYKTLILVSVIAGVTAFLGTSTNAYDPVAALRNVYGAQYAVATIYSVRAGHEGQFRDAMVKSGAFDKLLTGFVNERMLEPSPAASPSKVSFVSLQRYLDLATADFIEGGRTPEIKPHLLEPSTAIRLKLVEHILADWGWERGTKPVLIRAAAFKSDEIFRSNLSSLSFFKSGYVGQTGFVELVSDVKNIDEMRQRVEGRAGLSGVSIFERLDGAGYAAYSEFFRAPQNLTAFSLSTAGEGTLEGAQLATVVENYSPR